MSPDTIVEMIQTKIPGSQVETSGDECNFSVVVTSASFAGKSRIQCHRIVNNIFDAQIKNGELHALAIKTQVV